jgi:hypothetical protein
MDVLQQPLRCGVFPLSPPDVHEQARSPLRQTNAVLPIGLDVLAL